MLRSLPRAPLCRKNCEIGGSGRRGGFRNHSIQGAGSSPVFRKKKINHIIQMPQLDALTYFSQYVYLFITFSAVYYYVLYFIIPKIVSTLKIRQKLNSLAISQAENNKNGAQQQSGDLDSIRLVDKFSQHTKGSISSPSWLTESNNAGLKYNYLQNHAWVANTCQANAVESPNQWLISTVAMQLAHNLRLKKLLCDHIVRRITTI